MSNHTCSELADPKHTTTTPKRSQTLVLLLLYCTCSASGSMGGPFLQRLYYMHGGSLKWLSSCLQSVGFFVLLPFLFYSYCKYLSNPNSTGFFMDIRLFLSSVVIGIMYGLVNFMFAVGLSYIPISTSSLLFSTQLAFIALFAFFLVRQKFTFYIFNSILVTTFGAIVLGLHTSGDRPVGVTKDKYLFGFFFTLGGAALWGLATPLIELSYNKSTKPITNSILLQVQFVMNAVASMFCIVGMAINKEFRVIPYEARAFDLGEGKYYFIIVLVAILYQLSFLGTMGIISSRSSLFAGIFCSGLLPISEVAAFIIFHDKFSGEKGLSLGLSLWGFTSYFLGEYKKTLESKHKGKYILEDGVMDRKNDTESSNQEIEMNGNASRSNLQEV